MKLRRWTDKVAVTLLVSATQGFAHRIRMKVGNMHIQNKEQKFLSLNNIMHKCNPDNGRDSSLCKTARLFHQVLEVEITRWNRKASKEGVEEVADIPSASDEVVSFSDYFAYALGRRPLHLTHISIVEDETRMDDLVACIREWKEKDNSIFPSPEPVLLNFEEIMLDFEDIASDLFPQTDKPEGNEIVDSIGAKFVSITGLCHGFTPLSNIVLPKYTANDYLRRQSVAKKSNLKKITEPFLQATIIHVSDVLSPSDALCPSSLNGLYVLKSFAKDPLAVIRARVFGKESAMALNPIADINTKSFPHYSIAFEKDAWETGSSEYRDTNLTSNSALFIPSGHAVAFRGIDEGGGSVGVGWEEATLLRFCFLDASNLNEYKIHLHVESIFSTPANELLDILNDPSFDMSMVRDIPRVSSWNGAPLKEPSSSHYKPRRERRASYFASWQLKKSWDHQIIGLTLPTLSPPQIVDRGRQNITLTWLCPFIKDADDSNAVGYVVSWEGQDSDGKPLAHGLDTFEENYHNLHIENFKESTSEIQPKPLRQFKITIVGLQAASYYFFRVALVYGSGNDRKHALFSDPSYSALTNEQSIPYPVSSPPLIMDPIERDHSFPFLESSATSLVISVYAPYDDGGSTLLGYDVMALYVDPFRHSEKQWRILSHGVQLLTNSTHELNLAVSNLLPGGTYSFKIAARNGLGRGVWSQASDAAKVPSPNNPTSIGLNCDIDSKKKNVHVYGIGANPSYISPHHVAKGPIVTIDDISQRIIVQQDKEIEVWTSFWSPRIFSVTGEACWVDWDDNGSVMNSSEISNRVAIVKRGGRPLASLSRRVQSAGALGVLIIDDGRCNAYDQFCILGSTKDRENYWGSLDLQSSWAGIIIPVVFILEAGSHGRMEDLLLL